MSKFFNIMNSIKLNIRNLIAIICIAGVLILVGILMYHPVPEANKETVQRAVDQLIVLGFAVVVAYFFVASKNEADRLKHEQKQESEKP
jgi:hypothetical protein